jgi:hypothetical protein
MLGAVAGLAREGVELQDARASDILPGFFDLLDQIAHDRAIWSNAA